MKDVFAESYNKYVHYICRFSESKTIEYYKPDYNHISKYEYHN